MEALWQGGLNLIHALQQVRGPVLDAAFRGISVLGSEEFYLLLLPVMLWCLDFRLAASLTILFLLSGYLNTGLKDLFHQPRPFNIDPGVQLAAAAGSGLPSGHAQSSLVVWTGISHRIKKTWFWAAASTLIVLIGLSRVYLGVHFPTDVLAGWLAGLVVLAFYLAAHRNIEKKLLGLGTGGQIALALAVSLALLSVHPVAETVSETAVLAGFGAGLALNYRYVGFRVAGPLPQRALRFLAGGVVLLVLYLGLRTVFPVEGAPFYLWFRFLRYGLMGTWVSFGAPWLFCSLQLAPGARRPTS